jgi:hypothetical protein
MSLWFANKRRGWARTSAGFAALLMLVLAQFTCAATVSENRHRLQQQQLQDTLELNQIQSGRRSRADISPADTLRLDQMQLRQRMEQQQLEQQQVQRERLDHGRGGAESLIQQQRFAQERQLQLQQFDTEQRELLRTIKPQPLQRPSSSGVLQP